MAVFVNDTFTDTDSTNLTAHTGETGATWAKVTNETGVIKITSNKAKGDSGGNSAYYASGTPASADYDVEADISQITAQDVVGLIGRASTSAQTYYRAYGTTGNTWLIDKIVAGTVTNITTVTGSAFATGHWKFALSGTSLILTVDDVEKVSGTDSAITAAGKAGLFYQNSDWGFGTTGRPSDNFTATDAAGAAFDPNTMPGVTSFMASGGMIGRQDV